MILLEHSTKSLWTEVTGAASQITVSLNMMHWDKAFNKAAPQTLTKLVSTGSTELFSPPHQRLTLRSPGQTLNQYIEDEDMHPHYILGIIVHNPNAGNVTVDSKVRLTDPETGNVLVDMLASRNVVGPGSTIQIPLQL